MITAYLSHKFAESFQRREKAFGFDVNYSYLPAEIDPKFLIMHMDPFWLKYGFVGRNKCLMPKGNPSSLRFDHRNKYFQTWVGSYFVTTLIPFWFDSPLEVVKFFTRSFEPDQENWLKLYGAVHPQTKLIPETITEITTRKIGNFTQFIYRGELWSGLDDNVSNKPVSEDFLKIATETLTIYNNQPVTTEWLSPDNFPTPGHDRIRLFGYFSIIKVKPRRYILTYVCGAKDYEQQISAELLRIITNVALVSS